MLPSAVFPQWPASGLPRVPSYEPPVENVTDQINVKLKLVCEKPTPRDTSTTTDQIRGSSQSSARGRGHSRTLTNRKKKENRKKDMKKEKYEESMK